MISVINGEVFPTGLIESMVHNLKNNGIPYTLTDARSIKALAQLHPSTVQLRDYQDGAVNTALTNTLFGTWWPRGVIRIATGGGKTEIAADMILKTQVPTIFLVHRKDLVRQTVERFAKYGISGVEVTTVQSLMSFAMEFKKNYKDAEGKSKVRTDEWLKDKKDKQQKQAAFIQQKLQAIEQVFVDEAHLIASNMDNYNLFGSALQLMPNAYMRWGLTATPFMREHLYDWMLEGATGRALVEITNRELIDAGHLTECEVDMITMKRCETRPELSEWPTCYEHYIVSNPKRNEAIKESFKKYPKPALILVNKIGHGDILSAITGLPFLSGQSSATERKDAIEDLKDGTLNGVIASNIWDEGIDIANIKTVILAGAGKSEIKNLQRLGRGLRLSSGKNMLQLVDFIDQTPGLLARHSKIRKELWQEQGFKVSVKQGV